MAGNLEELHFNVILDHAQFDAEMTKVQNMATNLNTSLQKMLNVSDLKTKQIISSKGVQNAKDMANYLEQIRQKIQNMPRGNFLVGDADKLNATLQQVSGQLDKIVAKQTQHTGAVRGTNSQLISMSSVMRTLSMLMGTTFSVVGIRRFLSSLIEITGQFEVQKMALRAMLKDIDAADKIYQDLYRFSSESTYRFSELAKYAKQLAAFQIDKGSLLETTKMLGDVASGVGVSMDRLILAYGHVKSSGFLRGIQLRSFSQNGVPILEELSKMLTEIEGKAVSLGDVFDKMTKRQISFEMVEQAFKNMTSEGGQFYQMQEVLAKTLSGQINILKGRWENLLGAIGESNSGVLKNTVAWFSNLVSSMENIGRLIKSLIAGWGAYQVALFAMTAAVDGLSAAFSVGLFGAIKKVIVSLATMIATNPYVALAAAIGTVAFAIGQWSSKMSEAEKILNELTKGVNDYKAALTTEQAELDRLAAKMRLAKEGTEEYDNAKREMMNRFGPYIDELRAEGVQVDNLATLYGNLKNKIEDANKTRFLEATTESIRAKYAEASKTILENFQYTMKVVGQKLSASEQETLWQYVTGQVSKDFIRYNTPLIQYLKRGGGNHPYTGGSYNESFSVEQLRTQYVSATDAYNRAVDAAEAAFKTTARLRGEVKNTKDEMENWRDLVTKSITPGFENALAPKEDEDYFEYLDRVKKHFDEVDKFRQTALKNSKKIYEDEIDAIKKVDAALEGNILKDIEKGGRGGSSSGNKDADAISDLKSSISLLEKYKDAYDKLEPFIGPDAAKEWVFKEMGYDITNLDTDLEKLIATLRTFGQEGNEAADAVEARLGLDKASKFVKMQKELEKAQKSLEKYLETMQDWVDKNQDLTGTGAVYNVSKVIGDYNKAIGEAQKKARTATGYLLGGTSENSKERLAGIMDINAELARSKANALVTLRQNLTKLADDILKEQMEGFDLTNWNDKTLSQINAIKDALNGVEVPQEIKDLLVEFPELLKDLEAEIKRLKGEKIDKTVDPERFKKIAKQAKYIAERFVSVANALKEFADASGNSSLSQAADAVGRIAQNVKAAEEGAKAWGGWWGAIIGGASDLIEQLLGAFTETEQEANALKEALREIATDTAIKQFADNLKKAGESIFGENAMGGVNEAIKQLKELDEVISKMTGINHGGAIRPSILTTQGTYGGVEFTRKKETLFKLADMWSLERIAAETGMKILDDYGNFNVELLNWVKRAGWDLTEEEKKWIDEAIEISTNYAAAMSTIEDAAKSLLDNTLSDVADKMVDSWWEAGRAALDYADILEDVAKGYAKLIVQDMLMNAAFDDSRRKAFIDALKSGDTDTAMATVAAAMQAAEDMLPAVEQALQVFEPYRNLGGGESNSVGSGIKSITEDTANLLASYINAIRADVSYMRGMEEKGWGEVSAIGAAMPTLNDYLAQIAATNFDIAQNTQSMLSEMRSVIGAPGTSGSVVRVEAYR